MERSFLGIGDKADNGAFVAEGLDSISCSNPPPCVQISTIGMRTYCPVFEQEGHIAPRGPRWPGTGPNGSQWALSGDVNLCGCSPPPVFRAERNMTMSFTSEEAAALMGQRTKTTTSSAPVDAFDQHFRLTDERTGKPLKGVPYRIVTSDGDEHEGITDARGHTLRVSNDRDTSATLHVLEEYTPINPEWDKFL
ncbi:hypothetical protein M3A49_15715 [Paraburkholderia sp. CNPSo 3076]|uniref:hypothetical protein n=1 Tax=Paraburkholderia sp. CNPSo 3076 TaxID=2940936 RepID=UPI00224E40D7|nr:hypothetical protein [Paraburkholderia sp. CNPSo 3076]MCX5540927.1 hypothetical protein [Paraburkholderia sp. CNPSo 3076]